METFLAPIEEPEGLMMKLAYYFTRRQFGKVLTPLKVFGARMPLAFGLFGGKISKLDKKLTLPPETAMLIREQHRSEHPFGHALRHQSEKKITRALSICCGAKRPGSVHTNHNHD